MRGGVRVNKTRLRAAALAAVATLAGYGAVLAVRLIDAPRMIRFKLCLPRFCISLALLLGAAGIMTFAGERFLWLAIFPTVAIVALNAPALWGSICRLLKKRGRA